MQSYLRFERRVLNALVEEEGYSDLSLKAVDMTRAMTNILMGLISTQADDIEYNDQIIQLVEKTLPRLRKEALKARKERDRLEKEDEEELDD